MYFPYLRGKQFELLALRELAEILGQEQKVLPIIEPVRKPTGSGLDKCFQALSREGLEFILIGNPGVGALRDHVVSPAIKEYVTNHGDWYKQWNIGLIVDEDTPIDRLVSSVRELSPRKITLIHQGLSNRLEQLGQLTQEFEVPYNVISVNKLRKAHFSDLLSRSEPVSLRDRFPAEDRNSDYLPKTESIFSDDHLFFRAEGWLGFGDYLTVGEPYSESGFTPRAVAIHWTYEPDPTKPIMIRHFTSETDSNGTSNVGGKFLEAAGKLVTFLDTHEIHTMAAESVREYVINRSYPGLGIVKKLSIQNHLELVSGILSRT